MMDETIKTYQGNDVGASQCLVTLECFIGDVDGAELADDTVIVTGDAVTAINGLIWSLERRDTEIERLRQLLSTVACPAGGWNGMPKELVDICTVADCVKYNTCGCVFGDALRQQQSPHQHTGDSK